VLAVDASIENVDQVRAAVELATEVKTLGRIVGLPEKAADLIRARVTLPEARAALSAALAEADLTTRVDTSNRTAGGRKPDQENLNPLAIWSDIKSAKNLARSKK
jgi:hypothetical protein